MQLQELIDGLPVEVDRGRPETSVHEIHDDSRRVTRRGLFVARGGPDEDGRAYIDQAVAAGASAVLCDRAGLACTSYKDDSADVTWIVAAQVDQALSGRIAERFYGYPGRRLRLIGITGTNGKTTTAMITAHLLRQVGVPSGVISTVFIDDGIERRPSRLTTPGAIELSRILYGMVEHGCTCAVMEVSSHALQQGRTAALAFDTAVFTNLTRDHLDYHETMENYADAKALLFRDLAPGAYAVINADDTWAAHMVADCKARVLRCATNGAADDADCRATVLELEGRHSRARFDGPWGSVEPRLGLIGRHNVDNALLAVTAASTVVDVSANLNRSLASCPPVPGRLEPVAVASGPQVLVDYAHTDDALRQVLATLRPLTRGRLIVLFGCGGDRARTKRPLMAEVACALADQVVITSDNPRTEDPMAIIDDIRAGVTPSVPVRVEPDRARAIELAIRTADEDDTVLLAGKGHEPYQEIGRQRMPFDDREQAMKALRQRDAS